jgi:hypothetical protein
VAIAFIRYPSPSQVLVNGLTAAIAKLNSDDDPKPQLVSLPLQRINQPNLTLFASPVALQLAARWHLPAVEVAEQILAQLPWQAANIPPDQPGTASLLDFTIQVTSQGWINCQLSDSCLAAWLQLMTQFPPLVLERVQSSSSEICLRKPEDADALPLTAGLEAQESLIFSIQYAHARCCSLIRLAHRQELLQLVDPDQKISPLIWEIRAPHPVPWLDCQRRLWLTHPAERILIARLLDFPASLSSQKLRRSWRETFCLSASELAVPVSWPFPRHAVWQQAQAWSKAFEFFYCSCRIWGEVKVETPDLAGARLGLILATQAVLQFMLQELLEVPAPLEL